MRFLFVHQNFPGQYVHLATHLASIPGNEVVCISQRRGAALKGIRKIHYQPHREVTQGIHHYLRTTEAAIVNAQEVARCAAQLKREGFKPDLMIGHNGWGEIWYLKDIFPRSPLLGYFEFFYRFHGADTGFDKNDSITADTAPRIRTRNTGNLIGLEAVDWGQCPTLWQRSVYPLRAQSMLSVIHDGIDTDAVRPDASAQFTVPGSGLTLSAADEIVTYVARNLEPYRGFPTFMRCLPEVLKRRPAARVLIVGGDSTSYGRALPNGQTYRQQMLDELGDSLDLSRVHFLGKVPYASFLSILQISSAHVYLTYPFVLSWSMMEAMAAGCVLIASRTAPVTEMIRDGENGVLVDFFSPSQLADAVVEVLANPEEHAALRANARRLIVEQFDLKRICLPAQLNLVERLTR